MWPELEQALRLRRLPENIVISSEEGDSSDDSDEESCDFEEKAYTTKDDYRAGKLRMLLDFEQHLHLLQVSENAVGLRNEITSRLEQCWGGKLSADSTCRLQMMWESADSVWLLREWQSDSLLVLQRVCNIMEQIYPTAAQQHAIVDCSQLIAMFQERLKQWQHHADKLRQLHRDLSDMLRCWPQQHTVRTHLTHWGRDKIAAVSQTTLSNAFSWTKMSEFRLKFHWSLFPRVQLTVFQHWFR